MIGAKPTKEQVAALEKSHKLHFIALVQAAVFRISLARKFGLKSKQFLDYNKIFVPRLKKFAYRQKALQIRAGIPEIVPLKDLLDSFYTSAGVNRLVAIAKTYDAKGQGIGFIPLIIWAVIAIVAAYTAVEVTDETNTSTEEMKDLVDSTGDFCKANNLSPEQCRNLLQEQTKTIDTGGGGGILSGILMPLLLLGGGYLLFTNWDKIFGSKKAA